MKRKGLAAVIIILAAVAVVRSVIFVDETEFVIVTQFERPVRTLGQAGLEFKWPWQSVIRIDRRIQIFDPKPSEFLAREKKNVNLDVFICWRVDDPLLFNRRVIGGLAGAESRLEDDVMSALADEVGRNDREALVSLDPKVHKLDEIVAAVRQRCARQALTDYGIEIVDVRLKRITLPRQARESVFNRMRDERARIASQYRAEGEEEAMKIRAEADKEKTKTLAEAYRLSEETRGKAEAEATRIYAEAYRTDPAFYELRRTLEAYRKFLDEKTTLLLSSDSDLLKYLTAPPAVQPGAKENGTK